MNETEIALYAFARCKAPPVPLAYRGFEHKLTHDWILVDVSLYEPIIVTGYEWLTGIPNTAIVFPSDYHEEQLHEHYRRLSPGLARVQLRQLWNHSPSFRVTVGRLLLYEMQGLLRGTKP